MLPAEIRDADDYRAFVRHLMAEEGLNFHPDNAFIEYVDRKGKRTYDWDAASLRESLLMEAFDRLPQDEVYRIALEEHRKALHVGVEAMEATRMRGERSSQTAAKLAERLAAKIIAKGLRSQVMTAYNNGQDHACGLDQYASLKADKPDEAEWFAHDQAIDEVWTFLVDRKIIQSDTPARVVSLAFSEIS